MKITFLKNHLSYKKGESYSVDDYLANYLIRTKVAIEVKKGRKTKEEKF